MARRRPTHRPVTTPQSGSVTPTALIGLGLVGCGLFAAATAVCAWAWTLESEPVQGWHRVIVMDVSATVPMAERCANVARLASETLQNTPSSVALLATATARTGFVEHHLTVSRQATALLVHATDAQGEARAVREQVEQLTEVCLAVSATQESPVFAAIQEATLLLPRECGQTAHHCDVVAVSDGLEDTQPALSQAVHRGTPVDALLLTPGMDVSLCGIADRETRHSGPDLSAVRAAWTQAVPGIVVTAHCNIHRS